jgi:hypothetical protein
MMTLTPNWITKARYCVAMDHAMEARIDMGQQSTE